MAKIIKKKSDLVAKRNRTKAMYIIGHILLVLFGIVFIEVTFSLGSEIISVLSFLVSTVGLFMVHFTRDSVGIENAGVDGEEKAMKMLEKGLPNSFACINNAIITYENRHNELDIIVVGDTGVFIIEVKNTAGNIKGSYYDKVLKQEKRNETKEMRNPIQQVRTHADILQRYLKANGIRTWVQGVVFFVNPKCSPMISDIPDNGVPVFAVSSGGERQLMEYLQNVSPNSVSQEEIQRIISLI